MKTKIFNVMILDKSGSMSTIARQAVSGINEGLASIRNQQLKNPDQDNYVTLVAFCGCKIKTIYDQVPIAEVRDLSEKDYRPCCMTPLYDAVGTTISRIRQLAQDAAVAVTIITDGYENASREYDHKAIKALIESCKEQGWLFAYIGAEHDVENVAVGLSIDNSMQFDKDEAGTNLMFSIHNCSRAVWASKASEAMSLPCATEEEKGERLSKLKQAGKNFFSK